MSQIVLTDVQKQSVKFLLGNISRKMGCLLSLEMGMGKTLCCVKAIQKLHQNDKERFGPFLIVAPPSVLGFWKTEFAKLDFEGNVCIYHSSFKDEIIPIADCDVAICSYEGALACQGDTFNTVIIDEVQEIRNGKTRLFKLFKEKFSKVAGRVGVTGTPISNSLMDIYNIFEFLQPRLLGNKGEFRKNYQLVAKRGLATDAAPDHKSRALRQARRLGERIKSYTIHHYKTAKQHFSFDVPVELTDSQRAAYDDLDHRPVRKKRRKHTLADGDVVYSESHATPSARMKALKQIGEARGILAGDGCEDTHVSQFLDEHMDDLLALGSTAIFFARLNLMDKTKEFLTNKGVSFVEVQGSTSAKDRTEAIRAHNDGEVKVFLGSESACGSGISLFTLASMVITSPNWSPAVTAQVSARGSRPQNKNKIVVYNIYAPETIDDAIVKTNRLKCRIIASVLGDLPSDDAVMLAQMNRARESLRFKRHLETIQ